MYQLIYVNIFSERVINQWNKLNEDAVTAPTLNSLKGKIQSLYNDGSFTRLFKSAWPSGPSRGWCGQYRLLGCECVTTVTVNCAEFNRTDLQTSNQIKSKMNLAYRTKSQSCTFLIFVKIRTVWVGEWKLWWQNTWTRRMAKNRLNVLRPKMSRCFRSDRFHRCRMQRKSDSIRVAQMDRGPRPSGNRRIFTR